MSVSDLNGVSWRKSSRSGAGNDCVEFALVGDGAAVRDSKNPPAGTLRFSAAAWSAFLRIAKL